MSDTKSKLKALFASTGYPSKSDFKPIARKAGFNAKDINDFINATSSLVIYDKPKQDPKAHYVHGSYRWTFMIDLMDVSKYSAHNSGIHWLLNIVEWHSRKVFSFPLKTKSTEPIKDVVVPIIEDLPNCHVAPIRIVSDQGTEFSALYKWTKSRLNIDWLYTTPARKSTRPVERFNRTLWTAFARYWARPGRTDQSKRDYFRFLDFLPTFISNYNSKPHSTTKIVPDKAYAEGHTPTLDLTTQPSSSAPVVGQYARYLEPRGTFDKKSATPHWSSTIHLIESKNGTNYELAGVPGTKIASELLVVGDPEVDIEPDTPSEEPEGDRTIKRRQNEIAAKRHAARSLKEIHTRSDYKHGVAVDDGGRGRRNTSKAREVLKAVGRL